MLVTKQQHPENKNLFKCPGCEEYKDGREFKVRCYSPALSDIFEYRICETCRDIHYVFNVSDKVCKLSLAMRGKEQSEENIEITRQQMIAKNINSRLKRIIKDKRRYE